GLQSALNSKINSSEKGAAYGVASLGSASKLLLSQIPEELLGSVRYQDNWNAATNTPTLPSTPTESTKGYYYIVTVDGVFGGVEYKKDDYIISNGFSWGKIDNSTSVQSVAGKKGDVILSMGDIVGLQAFLDGKANTSGDNATGTLQTTISNSHTHSNKAVLDGITSGNVSNWNTAYDQRHTHDNKSLLDGITSRDLDLFRASVGGTASTTQGRTMSHFVDGGQFPNSNGVHGTVKLYVLPAGGANGYGNIRVTLSSAWGSGNASGRYVKDYYYLIQANSTGYHVNQSATQETI